MRLRILTTAGAAALIAGCAHQPGPGGSASATLRDASGREVGQARLAQTPSGLRLSLHASGMKAGTVGAHVHTTGRCDASDFASAGPHWNPTAKQHGRDNPAGMHKGDLPNLTVGANGRGRLEAVIEGASFTDVLDADGAALVIHAGPDDYRTDPSGNSGARVVCGVFAAS